MAQPTAGQQNDLRDHSVGELVKELTEDMRTLVRKEIELGKAELSEKGKRAGVGAGLLGGGATAGLLALGALTATLIALLDEVMELWLAALIVTVLWGAVAAALAMTG
jgi:hypothetical protein